jgi:glyoxylase-like metal-dependent hydrolase (beta-lactamase superfamily II)
MNPRYLICGQCSHPEAVVLPGGNPFKKRIFPSSVAVIDHPKHGITLFDTGYSSRFKEITRTLPERLYAIATPVTLDPERTAVRQLGRMGIRPSDVRRIFCSHFHADHVGGVADFPRAEYIYSKRGLDRLLEKSRFGQVRSGFLKALLPPDFQARGRPIESFAWSRSDFHFGPFRDGIDVWGDGTVVAVPLPGHDLGHYGLLVRREDGGRDFLVADACWTSRSYRENRMPSLIARAIFADPRGYRKTLENLHALHRRQPEIRIIPCHCSETLSALVTEP